jgi:hypothetical protein
MTTVYDTMNNLPDISFIGGTDKVFTFTCYKENGLDLLKISGGGTATWLLCPYGGFGTRTLEITGDINTDNSFDVVIPAASTLALRGKFIQQVTIIDYYGNTYRPGQGLVIILPAIPES